MPNISNSDIRTLLNKEVGRLEILNDSVDKLNKNIETVKEDIANAEKAHLIMQKAATISQEHLAAHLSGIVTQAVQAVIQKPYEFVCEFVERRGATEADLYLIKNGKQFDILEGTGGGLADVISFSLKVAYLMLSNVDKVLIIDEVSRHINSPYQRKNFAEVLSRLSSEFDIQLILNTTIQELIDIADKVITLKQTNDETFIV